MVPGAARRSAWWVSGLAIAAGCGGAPEHRLETLLFSDSAASTASTHSDTFDTRFELSRAPFLHAHLTVSHPSSWRARQVALGCTVRGPATDAGGRVDTTEALAAREEASAWVVPLIGSSAVKWVEGTYAVRCETAAGPVEGRFQLVDAAVVQSRPARIDMQSLFEGPGGGRSSPFDTPSPSDAQPEPASTLDQLFRHLHEPPASADLPPALPPLSPAPRSSATGPRIYAAGTADATDGVVGDRFDSSSLKYLSFDFDVPGGGKYTIDGCVYERAQTGVVSQVSTSLSVDQRGSVTLHGSFGADDPGQILPGDYLLRCHAEGVEVPPVRFSVYGRARPNLQFSRTAKRPWPNVRASSISLLSCRYTCSEDAQAGTRFIGSPRYIVPEVRIDIQPAQQPIDFTFTCHFFTDTGRVIGRSSRRFEIPADHTWYSMREGWGSANGNYWETGTYYAECDANGTFLAGRYFEVERR